MKLPDFKRYLHEYLTIRAFESPFQKPCYLFEQPTEIAIVIKYDKYFVDVLLLIYLVSCCLFDVELTTIGLIRAQEQIRASHMRNLFRMEMVSFTVKNDNFLKNTISFNF